MTLFQIIAPPVIGGIIGYITNDIAIRMLFRPHEAKYIFGVRVPFTPGIVPRRKNDLAETLGKAIVAKFFNADDLELVFTADSFADAIADRVVMLLRSDASFSGLRADVEGLDGEKLEAELCMRIQASIAMSDLPETMAREGSAMAADIYAKNPAMSSIALNFTNSLQEPLAEAIREFVIEHGFSLMMPCLARELKEAGEIPLSEMTERAFGSDDEALKNAVKRLYQHFMLSHVRPIVESIPVGEMITEKIITMTSKEVEDLVLTVVNKELRLVVLFGGILGALIGAVNIFI